MLGVWSLTLQNLKIIQGCKCVLSVLTEHRYVVVAFSFGFGLLQRELLTVEVRELMEPENDIAKTKDRADEHENADTQLELAHDFM